MLRFELKKVLGSTGGKIATLAFVCVLLFSCWQSASGCNRVIWVNEQGDEEKGFVAAKNFTQPRTNGRDTWMKRIWQKSSGS